MKDGEFFDSSAVPFGEPILAPGDVVADKYRIDAVLGRGGMSMVYRATHLQLDQLVAIKVLSPAAFALPEYVARLQREARAASRIKSEHVVRIFDIGELPGKRIPYLVMEHLTGADLAAVLARRGPLPVGFAIECMMQVCEALAEAHAVGIIHRDLKPANLFLTESVDGSPCVKVLDFGISRCLHRHALSPLTDPGTVLGTPSYMAPEQMESTENVSPRSDIWALGAILYELLVGEPPFCGQSLPQLFVKIMRSKTPRPSRSRRDVGPAIDDIVARCLALEPEDRFASVADLAWELSALGPPAARDAAARISRVVDRRASETGTDKVLPPVRLTIRPPERASLSALRALPSKRTIAAMVTATVTGLAAGFAMLAGGHPHDADASAIVPTSHADPPETTNDPIEVVESVTSMTAVTSATMGVPDATAPAILPIARAVRVRASVPADPAAANDPADAGAPPPTPRRERDVSDAGAAAPLAAAPPVGAVPALGMLEEVAPVDPPGNAD